MNQKNDILACDRLERTVIGECECDPMSDGITDDDRKLCDSNLSVDSDDEE